MKKFLKDKLSLILITAFATVGLSMPLAALLFAPHLYKPVLGKKYNIVQGLGLERGIYAEKARLQGTLGRTLIKKDGRSFFYAPKKNLITDSGEAFLVDAWQNIVELEIMKFHGLGTGAVAAAEGNTGCGTELTTQYNPDSTRATGSLTEASASVFRTVGTNTVDASAAVTEWCLLSTATGAATMFSRVVFAAINLTSGDSLQTTWDLTVE